MRRLIEVLSNIVIILIVGLAGSAVGYYSAGYAPKQNAPLSNARETIGSPAKSDAPADAAKSVKKDLAALPLSPQMSAVAFTPQLTQVALVPPAPSAAAVPPMPSAAAVPPMPSAVAVPAMPAAVAPRQRSQSEERAEAERHKGKVQSRYSSCLHDAEQAFVRNWDQTCKLGEEARRKKYQHCIGTTGQSRATCSRIFAAIPEKNCKLPAKLTESFGARLQKTARRCLLERQAGLE